MGAYFKATLKGDIKAQAQAQMRARAKRLEVLLKQEVGEIVARTTSGRSVTDATFHKYTDGYIAFKGRPNKKGKSRNTYPPDLTFTGKMLQGMRSKVKTSGKVIVGTIYFLTSQSIKAFANQVLFKRNFFGLSNEQKQRILKGLNSI